MDLKTGADAFTAGGLADILNGGGNLEWPVKLLLGAQRVVRNWVVAGAGQAGAEHHTGWEDIDASQSHERNIAGSRRRRPRVSVTEYVSCKVTAQTTAEWNRLFQRCAELALFIVASARLRSHLGGCSGSACAGGAISNARARCRAG